jgi:hypothetical protein
MGDRIRTLVIIVVTTVWALSFLASFVVSGYTPPPEINSIFMGTVGATLATTPIASRRGRGREEDEQEPRPREG